MMSKQEPDVGTLSPSLKLVVDRSTKVYSNVNHHHESFWNESWRKSDGLIRYEGAYGGIYFFDRLS